MILTKPIEDYYVQYDIFSPKSVFCKYDLELQFVGDYFPRDSFKVDLNDIVTHLIIWVNNKIKLLSLTLKLDLYKITTTLIHKIDNLYLVKLVPELYSKDISNHCIDFRKFNTKELELQFERSFYNMIEVYCFRIIKS